MKVEGNSYRFHAAKNDDAGLQQKYTDALEGCVFTFTAYDTPAEDGTVGEGTLTSPQAENSSSFTYKKVTFVDGECAVELVPENGGILINVGNVEIGTQWTYGKDGNLYWETTYSKYGQLEISFYKV